MLEIRANSIFLLHHLLLILVPVQITNRSTTAEAIILITVKFYFAFTMITFTNMISHLPLSFQQLSLYPLQYPVCPFRIRVG
jgi:hypothetical protein